MDNNKKFFRYTDSVRMLEFVNSSAGATVVCCDDYWHKVTIVNGNYYDGTQILDKIINITAPYIIIPVNYKKDGDDTCFLFQNSINAVKVLASFGLQLELKQHIKLKMNIQFEHCPFTDVPIKAMSIIEKLVSKRTNIKERVVDLRNFSKDPDLKDIYAPLELKTIHDRVIKYIKQILVRPSIILLNNNNLSSKSIIEALKIFNIKLKGLDLRHNKFTWQVFEKLPFLKITDLWLDGNPLCDSTVTTKRYIIKKVKKVFPHVTNLDDVDISTPPIGDIVPLKNFIPNPEGTTFIDHFVHHYFVLYESPIRFKLRHIYHPRATLSISFCDLTFGTEVSVNDYSKISRNILTVSNMCRVYDTLKIGSKQIEETISNLPTVLFDRYSFNVDVPVFKKNIVIINVCGVFKNFGTLATGNLYYFDRTFILHPWILLPGEWKVINDIWAITSITPSKVDASFTQPKKTIKTDFSIMIHSKAKDKDVLQRMMSELTEMNGVWSLKFLTESHWNLEMALQAFIDQCKANLIPPQAFKSRSLDNSFM